MVLLVTWLIIYVILQGLVNHDFENRLKLLEKEMKRIKKGW